jgi:hypothetical protein
MQKNILLIKEKKEKKTEPRPRPPSRTERPVVVLVLRRTRHCQVDLYQQVARNFVGNQTVETMRART